MNKDSYVNLFHIFIVVPFLFYIYFYRKSASNTIFNILLITAIVGIIYHSYKLFYLPADQKYKNFVYLTHLVIVFPLFIYIGIKKEKTERKYFEILLMVMFAALGYHSYNFLYYNYISPPKAQLSPSLSGAFVDLSTYGELEKYLYK